MKTLWQVIAIGVLVVAACQWLILGEQVLHGVVLVYKMGWSLPVLTAGTETLSVFLALSIAAAATGGLTAWRLREASPGLGRRARVAAYSLVGGIVLWLGLIISPIVDLVRR